MYFLMDPTVDPTQSLEAKTKKESPILPPDHKKKEAQLKLHVHKPKPKPETEP